MSAGVELFQPGADPRIGAMIQDRYRVVRKLGEGGMGAVYEAEHVLIKRRVAIKFLHAQFASNAEIVARFHREALAATSIGNEHIIEVLDMGRLPDGAVFMVLEFLDGKSLGALLDEMGTPPLGRVARIAMQICDALGAAHAKGIVHRDLKPENVYVIKRGADPDFVKVLDFGIAKVKDASDGVGLATRTGAALGTPYFMAPEQCQGAKDVDLRTDLYALGVILFRALTGSYPFGADTFPMLVVQICTAEPAPVRFFRPELPTEIDAIVARLLAKKREERFPDCASLRSALEPFAGYDRSTLVGEVQSAPVMNELARAPTPAPSTLASVVGPSSPSRTGARFDFAEPVPQRRSFGLVVAVCVMVGAGASGAFLFTRSHVAPVQAAARAIVPVQPTQPPASVVDPPRIVPASAANLVPAVERTVQVRMVTTPADAELRLDGQRIANPFDAELPQSASVHRLEAHRAGYASVVQDLSLQFAQTVRITMNRGHGVDDRRAHAAATPAQTTEPVQAAAVPQTVAPPPQVAVEPRAELTAAPAPRAEPAVQPAAVHPAAEAPAPPPAAPTSSASNGGNTAIVPAAQGVRTPF